jgi:hypothetical protein
MFGEACTSSKEDNKRSHIHHRIPLIVKQNINVEQNKNKQKCFLRLNHLPGKKGAEVWVDLGRVRCPVLAHFHMAEGQGDRAEGSTTWRTSVIFPVQTLIT